MSFVEVEKDPAGLPGSVPPYVIIIVIRCFKDYLRAPGPLNSRPLLI
jgi:hypothetical protein